MNVTRAYYPYMALMSLWLKLLDTDPHEAEHVYHIASKMRNDLK